MLLPENKIYGAVVQVDDKSFLYTQTDTSPFPEQPISYERAPEPPVVSFVSRHSDITG